MLSWHKSQRKFTLIAQMWHSECVLLIYFCCPKYWIMFTLLCYNSLISDAPDISRHHTGLLRFLRYKYVFQLFVFQDLEIKCICLVAGIPASFWSHCVLLSNRVRWPMVRYWFQWLPLLTRASDCGKWGDERTPDSSRHSTRNLMGFVVPAVTFCRARSVFRCIAVLPDLTSSRVPRETVEWINT